jgi:4-alpha-glucanotransferase
VAYPAPHHNDTPRGCYVPRPPAERAPVHRYAPEAATDPVWAMVRLAWASVADRAIIPVQDLLDLGSDARMNIPGVPDGNWGWRLEPKAVTARHLDRLGELTATYGRQPKGPVARDR